MADRKFEAWKNWCEQSRKDKFFAKKSTLIDNLWGVRTERLLKQCFDAIRFSNTNMKFETMRMELEAKIPEREDLEFKRECLEKQTATKTKRDQPQAAGMFTGNDKAHFMLKVIF